MPEVTDTLNDDSGVNKPNDSQLEQISAVLRGDDIQATDDDPVASRDDDPEKKSAKPTNLTELAEELSYKVEDLYDLKVPTAEGVDELTLGELKNLSETRGDFELERLKFEEGRTEAEKEYNQRVAELKELLNAVPAQYLKEGPMQAAAERAEKKQVQNRTDTLRLIPEWSDQDVATSDLKGIQEYLEGWFPRNTLATTQFDANMLKYFRDTWKQDTRIKRALASIKEVKPKLKTDKSKRTSIKPGDKTPSKITRPNSRQSILDQIKEIQIK